MKKLFTFTVLLCLAVLVQAQTKWELDRSHSKIGFSVVHMMISDVEGQFDEFEGTVVSTGDEFNGAEVNFTAKTASINTDNERRDNHLRGEDFFNAEENPEITFDGTIEKEGDQYYLVGDFTMKGVTKEKKFDVRYNGTIDGRRGQKAGFKVIGSIDRFDYGVTWDRTMDTGGLVVSEEVQIICNIELNEVVPE